MKELPWRTLSRDSKKVTLNKFEGDFSFIPTTSSSFESDQIRKAVVLDLETTGIDKANDKIIEIGIRSFSFNRETGDITNLNQDYSGLEDPERSLPKEITLLTGLEDKDLKDKKIDWDKVVEILSEAQLVIAHNARFDRGFLDVYLEESKKKIWACSASQVNWLEHGFTKKSLETLCAYHGFFADAHRALNDVDALIHLLSMKDKNDKPYFAELMENARKPRVRVSATNSPFETKDLLKARGYRWNNNSRVWSKEILAELSDEEAKWLTDNVYQGEFRGNTEEIPLVKNFA